jgi:hypothetical protein
MQLLDQKDMESIKMFTSGFISEINTSANRFISLLFERWNALTDFERVYYKNDYARMLILYSVALSLCILVYKCRYTKKSYKVKNSVSRVPNEPEPEPETDLDSDESLPPLVPLSPRMINHCMSDEQTEIISTCGSERNHNYVTHDELSVHSHMNWKDTEDYTDIMISKSEKKLIELFRKELLEQNTYNVELELKLESSIQKQTELEQRNIMLELNVKDQKNIIRKLSDDNKDLRSESNNFKKVNEKLEQRMNHLKGDYTKLKDEIVEQLVEQQHINEKSEQKMNQLEQKNTELLDKMEGFVNICKEYVNECKKFYLGTEESCTGANNARTYIDNIINDPGFKSLHDFLKKQTEPKQKNPPQKKTT